MPVSELSPATPTLPDWPTLWLDTLQWQPTESQIQHFQALYAQILLGNQQLNLTRITDPLEFAEKHLWDSLSGIQPFLPQTVAGTSPSSTSESALSSQPWQVIDIGTGAGFPGLPIAIVQPHWRVTLLDSTRKKITFLNQLIQALGLANVTAMVGRVEEVGQQRHYREHYDLAVIRAVAAASVCAEYALPLLQVGGLAVLYRGHWTDAETESLTIAAEQLGAKIETITSFQTPITRSDRHCIQLRKVKPTPKTYPRAIGVPEQKPLGS